MAEIVLTTEQKEVIGNRGGTLLVSAAAGSGKTKVLLDRVICRAEEAQADLDDFLLITYTKAAAAELRGKLLAQLSARLAKEPDNRFLQNQMQRVYLAQISTVHSFCGKILREYAAVQGLPTDFHICEELEAEPLRARAMELTLQEIYTAADPDIEYVEALDMLSDGRDDGKLPDIIQQLYSHMQCHCDPKKRLRELQSSLDFSDCTDVGQTVWGEYLLSELHRKARECAQIMQRAMVLIENSENLQPHIPLFEGELAVLQKLETATWDEAMRTKLPSKQLRFKDAQKGPVQEEIKAMRARVRDAIKGMLEKFVLPSENGLKDLEGCAVALRGILRLTERYGAHYLNEKRRRHALDYNDLEHEMLRLVTDGCGNPTATAREISERFVEIMVDEYQDTNAVQDTIFQAISKNGNNLFFVGDVKQAIYRFRMADPTIFLKKYHSFADYAEAADGEPRKILLSHNFRSHPAILSAANDVFHLTMTERVGGLNYGADEELRHIEWKQADPDTPAVELHCIASDGEKRDEVEAEFVAQRIAEMIRNGEKIPDGERLRRIEARDIVILMRSVSKRGDIYVKALQKRGIRCICSKENIFETEEIKLLISLLQVIDNPHQDIPLLSVLFSPLFCVSSETLAKLRAENRSADTYETLRSAQEMQEIVEKIDRWRDVSQTETLRTLLETLDEELFIRVIFRAMDCGENRVRNLESFYALADAREGSLADFLRYLESLHESGGTAAADDGNAVRLMSVHTSKGLEFPVVFLANLSGQFNDGDTRETVMLNPKLGIGARVHDRKYRLKYRTMAHVAISVCEKSELRSDEMRILYVGMTRPKYRLVMTCCAAHLKKRLSDLAQNLTVPSESIALEKVNCAGDWVLMAALTHTEAGELFQIGGYPEHRKVSEYPWKITFLEIEDIQPAETEESEVPAIEEAALLQPKFSEYPHAAATMLPSKLTATQLKGRGVDAEISENTTPHKPKLPFARPYLHRGQRPLSPTERGTAIHAAMQYLNYAACGSVGEIDAELDRLVQSEFLTAPQREVISAEMLARFFASPIGQRASAAEKVMREFKFSLLQDASVLDPTAAGEELLLQGVVDCCFFENDGLTVIDFKSDRVAAGEEQARAEHYRGQINTYAQALKRIFGVPVKECVLYFFATGAAISI